MKQVVVFAFSGANWIQIDCKALFQNKAMLVFKVVFEVKRVQVVSAVINTICICLGVYEWPTQKNKKAILPKQIMTTILNI